MIKPSDIAFPEITCKTCGALVSVQLRRAPAEPCWEVVCHCHDMWLVFCYAHLYQILLEMAAICDEIAHIPPHIKEYDVDDSQPLVEETTEFRVLIEVAEAAQLGSPMHIQGKRGIVTGIDKDGRVWLSPSLPGGS